MDSWASQTYPRLTGTLVDTRNADATWDRLGSIARLLHHAATQVWSDAAEAAAASPLHDLGLGVYLAHAQASALLPDDYELTDVDPVPELEERTPLQLLTQAEALTRPLPMCQPDLVHGSQLVVDLCDLIREARGLGY
jgi:hypothetical protein